jgi:hypothetical protein
VAEQSEMSEISEVESPNVTVEGDPELIQEAANSSFLADESSAATATLGRIEVEKIPAPGANLEDTSTGPQDEQHTEFSGIPSGKSSKPQTGDELDALLDRIRQDRDRGKPKPKEPREPEEPEEPEETGEAEASSELGRRILEAADVVSPEARDRLADASRREILESAVVALVKADVLSADALAEALGE